MGNIFSISLSCDSLNTRCWDYSCGQAEFVCNLEKNLHALETALAKLMEKRNDVERRVKTAEEQPEMEPLDQVQGWLERAERIINEADALISASPQEVQRLCIGGCCSWNPMSSHKFGKEIAQKLQQIEVLKSEGDFDMVADRAPKALVTEQPCEPAVGLESTFNMVCSSLEEEGVTIIGLYGIGGVGKTRLLTEINNRFDFSNYGFDHALIWVVVSKGFYVGKIQDDIARKIGLSISDGTWNDKTSEEKASNIFHALSRGKFMLLLDDIWERVDLSEVGIPIPTHENGCKLIFTTRSLDVCGQMGAQKRIEVKCLSKEDAWNLFQEKVGERTLDSHPRIREIAQEVVNECEGLPLALITIGRAMACKNTPEEWEYAVGVLKRSSAASISQEMDEKVYPRLKFSYDSLPNDMLRSCLLYCSLFSEDFIIEKERLIDCWIAEGFLDEHDSATQSRNHGHHIIGCLLNACLLEKAGYSEVKMHDVIRDMTFWMRNKFEQKKRKYFVKAGYQLTDVPKVAEWRGVRRMSLMENKIENLIEAPNCPNLQTLFLNENKLKVIESDFFQFMGGLKVLDLSYNRGITELPLSISKLVSLEYLDLSFTGIRQLPIELKALQRLKCLILVLIRQGITIPRELISAFSKLQVLRMDYSDTLEHNEWLVEELQSLNHLNVLTLTIRSDFAFEGLLSAERLHSCIEHIQLKGLRGTEQFNISSLANVRGLKQLDLDGCKSLKELKIEFAEEGCRMIKSPAQFQTSRVVTQQWFQSLCLVQIRGCPELRDLTWLILAPNLTDLNVMHCDKMEEIINKRKLSQVATQVGTLSPFERLESLMLQHLPELNSICNGALPFSCLKSILVSKCPKLRRLPLNSCNAKKNKISIIGDTEWWNQLEWEDEFTRHAFLQSFKARSRYS